MAEERSTVGRAESEDPLEALVTRLMASVSCAEQERGSSTAKGRSDGYARGKKQKAKVAGDARQDDVDPWKALSDQVNDEISRQIYGELDKQLDAQMMAELEKCQEEQSRRMDEELDRQLQEQLDAMLEANLESELRDDGEEAYDYYSEDDDYYSTDEEEERIQNLPWSEGGEGGIDSLGLNEFLTADGAPAADVGFGSIFGRKKYSEEQLQAMVDALYGEGGGKLSAPGAWGRGEWRPKGDTGGSP